MACKNAYRTRTINNVKNLEKSILMKSVSSSIDTGRLLFGVDSKAGANVILQNNLEEFEWVVRNKIYPTFYGRYINGENGLTKEEIDFLHRKGCKIAAIYESNGAKKTEADGANIANEIIIRAQELGIPEKTAIFLEIGESENASTKFMKGFAETLIKKAYTPAFKCNTDAKFDFDREFSRGMQTNAEVFKECLIWAVSPTLKEYDRITTTHLIHPDNWKPFAPSGITRREIAIWQYGKDCHPIEDDEGNLTIFNLNLVRNERILKEKMF